MSTDSEKNAWLSVYGRAQGHQHRCVLGRIIVLELQFRDILQSVWNVLQCSFVQHGRDFGGERARVTRGELTCWSGWGEYMKHGIRIERNLRYGVRAIWRWNRSCRDAHENGSWTTRAGFDCKGWPYLSLCDSSLIFWRMASKSLQSLADLYPRSNGCGLEEMSRLQCNALRVRQGYRMSIIFWWECTDIRENVFAIIGIEIKYLIWPIDSAVLSMDA